MNDSNDSSASQTPSVPLPQSTNTTHATDDNAAAAKAALSSDAPPLIPDVVTSPEAAVDVAVMKPAVMKPSLRAPQNTEDTGDAARDSEQLSGGKQSVSKQAVLIPAATEAVTQSPPPISALKATDQTAVPDSGEWIVIADTVRGASHLRSGLPNQDAVLCVRESTVRAPVIVTVSDGHGSDKCFRSNRGSRFAVRVGAEILGEFLVERRASDSPVNQEPENQKKIGDALANEYVRRWRTLVEADIKREPLSEPEFARVIEKDGAGARAMIEANPFLAYGATALAFLLTDEFALYLQLGDGEILTVSETGAVTQPLAKDARLLANETTSLCLEKAAGDFRFAIKATQENLPALIIMTTDGYANSFSTTEGFHQVGGDVLAMLRETGFAAVNRAVKSWLEEATTQGSGDDCTLALIVRTNALTTASNTHA